MAANASIQITGAIQAAPGGSATIGPLTISSAAANYQVQTIVLQSGANTITPPTLPAPTGCLIILPATNTSIVTLKGISGDTGIAIGKTTTQLLTWDSTAVPTSFVLNSVSTQTGLVTEIIFF